MIIKVLKSWCSPDIFRQTPNYSGMWKDCQFIDAEDNRDADFVIVLNFTREDIEVTSNEENIFCVIQEPYIKKDLKLMLYNQKQYSKVFSHHRFLDSEKYIASNPMLAWHVDKSYDELSTISLSDLKKDKTISCIASNLKHLKGHKQRLEFVNHLKSSNFPIDLFGKGIKFLDDKWDGLSDYKYSIAIENSSSNDYWTEKIADCFLAYTMPIYYGCTNIDEYFPKGSILKIDITNPEQAIETIKKAIKDNLWEKNIEQIKEARRLILDEYNFFNQISEICKQYSYNSKAKKPLTIKKYKQKSLKRALIKLGVIS